MYNDRRNPVVHTRQNRLLREIRGQGSEKGFKWPGKPQPSRGAAARRRRNNNNDNNNNDNDNDNMRSRPDRQSRTGFLVEQYYYLLLCEGTTAPFSPPCPLSCERAFRERRTSRGISVCCLLCARRTRRVQGYYVSGFREFRVVRARATVVVDYGRRYGF